MSAFPWKKLKHGGFSHTAPWLPAQPDAETNNVEVSAPISCRLYKHYVCNIPILYSLNAKNSLASSRLCRYFRD